MSEYKTAAAYVRVSSDGQVEYSPDSQIKLLKEYARKNGMYLPDENIFRDDGISGKDAKHRPEFSRMIALAKSEAHPFDVIIVWKFSRFARNQEESIVYKNLLRKCNVEVRSISEPIIDGAFGTLIERIIEWMDEFYLTNLSTEVKRGMLEKVSRGEVVSCAPIGYCSKDKTLYPSDQADVVRRMFEMYSEGIGTRTIAKTFNDEGVLSKRGNPIDSRLVDYVLHNPVYIGKIRWSPEGRYASHRDFDNSTIIVTDGTHEPLIDIDLWNSVQERLEKVKKTYVKHQQHERKTPIQFMLKGLLRCSSCGSTLTYSSAKEPSVQCHRYSHGTCNVSHYISINLANSIVSDALAYSVATLNFQIAPQAIQTTKDFDKLLAAEKRKLERIKLAFEAGADTLEEYADNKKLIQTRINDIESEKAAAFKMSNVSLKDFSKKVTSVISLIKDPTATEAAKNEALQTIIHHIDFDSQTKKMTLYFHSV